MQLFASEVKQGYYNQNKYKFSKSWFHLVGIQTRALLWHGKAASVHTESAILLVTHADTTSDMYLRYVPLKHAPKICTCDVL